MYDLPHRMFFFLRRCSCGGIIWPFTKQHWNLQGELRPNKPRPNVFSKHDSGPDPRRVKCILDELSTKTESEIIIES